LTLRDIHHAYLGLLLRRTVVEREGISSSTPSAVFSNAWHITVALWDQAAIRLVVAAPTLEAILKTTVGKALLCSSIETMLHIAVLIVVDGLG